MNLVMTNDVRLVGKDIVHVWHVPLDGSLSPNDSLSLSPDELERAKRFRLDGDRHTFVLCRSALRRILSHYLNTGSRDIRFHYNDFGKPQVETPTNQHSLRFNVSHSGTIALIAVTHAHQVGVDVEAITDLNDVDSLSEISLSARELAHLQAAPADRRPELFCNLWTCKEAVAKADGRGLSIPLPEIEFAVSEHAVTRLTSIAGERLAASNWSVNQFAPARGYLGAVASISSEFAIKHISYSALGDACFIGVPQNSTLAYI